MLKIGLALGGGGAKGLAHVPMLEVFDELGIRPHRIAGTSIGAIMGALYAAGINGQRIRAGIDRMVVSRDDSFTEAIKKREALKWFEFLRPDFKGPGLFKGEPFIDFLSDAIGAHTFEDLATPLRVVATDFWHSQSVVMETGDLMSAIKASMGLPGVFTPVERDGHVLIDGGGVNPVPYDLLDDCDLTVAIDVMGYLSGDDKHKLPGPLRAVLGTFDIMQNSIIAEKLRHSPPDIYIKPNITGVDILEFFKADDVYRQAEPAAAELREKLREALD